MKRPECAVMIKDYTGEITQHSIHKTSKEAQVIARDLALEKLRNEGVQTESHNNKVYNFPNGYSIMVKKVKSDF